MFFKNYDQKEVIDCLLKERELLIKRVERLERFLKLCHSETATWCIWCGDIKKDTKKIKGRKVR